MENTDNKQYVAYYRISLDKAMRDEHGRKVKDSTFGLDAQKAIVQYYYKPIKEFVEVKSGKNITDRKVFQECLEYCIKHNAYLVCAKQDRLSRNVDDCRNILEQLKGRLVLCDIPGNIDKFTLTMYAAFSERERELTSIRTSLALQQKIKTEGKWQKINQDYVNGTVGKLGTAALVEKAKDNEHNQRAASVICSKVKEGMTYQQILVHLNNSKHLTSTGKPFNSVTQVSRIYHKFCK